MKPVIASGLTPETEYTFKVETLDSKLSETITVTTLPKEPELPVEP